MFRDQFRVWLILLLITPLHYVFAETTQTWIELRSPNFHVITNANEKEARQVAYQFELIRAVFRDLFKLSGSGKDEPVIIIAAKDEKTLKTLLPEFWARKGLAHPAGIFGGWEDRNYIALRLDVMDVSAYEPVYHEYFHYLNRRSIPQLPLWLVEGMAEVFGNIRIEGKKVLVGEPSASHVFLLRQNALLPLSTLFEVDASSPYYNEKNKASIFYAESWALTHYLMVRDGQDKTHNLTDFIHLFEMNVQPTEAARRTIGDPKDLQTALNHYVHNESFHVEPLMTPNIDESGFIEQPLSEADSLAVRGDFMAHDHHYDEAEKMLRQSLKLDPKLSDACESMGFLYTMQGQTAEAIKWYTEALTLNSESYIAHYYYALNLMNGRAGDDWATVAELNLRAALTINPNFAPAYDHLAYLLALLSPNQKPDEALALLLHALELDRGNVDYRIRGVYVLERLERADDALRVAKAAVSLAKTREQKTEASVALNSAQHFQAYKDKVEDFNKAQTKAKSESLTAAPQVPSQNPTHAQSDNYGLGRNERGSQTVGPAEVLSDTMGVDFGPYLQRIVHDVKQNWYPLIPDIARPPVSKRGKLAIEFAILKNGSVPAMQLVATSGDVALDRAAWASIRNTQPFPPLPPEFHGDHLSLRFYYYYNPGKDDVQKSADTKKP